MDNMRGYPDWIAVDWGTSRLRAWAIDRNGNVIAESTSEKGMNSLSPDDFEPALLEIIGGWIGGETLVIACGMVGSRQGWIEASYHAVPCPPHPGGFARPDVLDPRLEVHIVPGLKQESPADVMRGEETQIAGYLRNDPDFDGVICLPGTHTKWAHISAGEVVSFRTFMTGELFSLLSEKSVLRHAIEAETWDQAAFLDGVSDTISRPEYFAANLFSIRANRLLFGAAKGAPRARLSGLLIGAEIAAARPYWLGRNVVLLGSKTIAAAYETALKAQGVSPSTVDGASMTISGLIAARGALIEA